MAQTTAVATARRAARSYLADTVGQDGGWGYRHGGQSFVEPTALAILALQQKGDDYQEAVDRGLSFLRRCRGEGEWGIFPGDDGGTWMVSLAALAFNAVRLREEAVSACRTLLAMSDGYGGRLSAETVRVQQRIFRIDGTVKGWPWLPGVGRKSTCPSPPSRPRPIPLSSGPGRYRARKWSVAIIFWATGCAGWV